MPYVQTFKVRGSGNFPLDMLRYEQCFPDTSEDSINMASVGTVGTIYGEDIPPTRNITLRRYTIERFRPVSRARWSSFGWQYVNASLSERKL